MYDLWLYELMVHLKVPMKWSDPTVYLDLGGVKNPGQVMADLNDIILRARYFKWMQDLSICSCRLFIRFIFSLPLFDILYHSKSRVLILELLSII
jgi:hypothetical protein